MRADEPAPTAPTRYGAYVGLADPRGLAEGAIEALDALTEQLGLVNEATAAGADPGLVGTSTSAQAGAVASVAFLRQVAARPGDLEDPGLRNARAIVHVAAPTPEPVCALSELLAKLAAPRPLRIITGAALPMSYTSNRMHDYAYARRVLQRPADEAPNGFLVPMNKTSAWWQKSWMERHTYFLPRYDAEGHQVAEGHALAAEEGIPYLFRRTYRQPQNSTPDGTYDFINYFECADADIEHFEATCAALRDVTRNPEWAYVREGPTWQGRRVAGWADVLQA